MSQILLMLAALVAIIVLPVMLAARIVGAGKTAFGSVLLAVFLQACLSTITQQFISSHLAAALIAVIGGSAIYAFTLDTTILRGFVVSILAVIIAVAAIVLLAGSFAFLDSAT